ncbi:MAG: fumarylacetoacetate hydrolase family protein [Actinomycetota bacterium]
MGDDGAAYRVGQPEADLDPTFLVGHGRSELERRLESGLLDPIELDGQRIGAPIPTPTLVACIGLNYRQHVEETGAELPTEPVVFMKSPRTVIGPNDPVVVPRGSTTTDWEIELAVIIGRRTHLLESPAVAGAHIAGYAISNDVSERTFQLERGGQWCKGKSCDTFNPLGPYLVAADEVDPGNLDLRLTVNGETRQAANTADMIFGVDVIVWYLSQFMVLDAGDVINTGTPSGVALGDPDGPYLEPGDALELEITGLGRQRQTVVGRP